MKPWEWYGIYKRVFMTPDGRAVMADLIRRYRVHGTTYRDNAQQMAYCEGQRSVILDIMKHVRLSDDEIMKLRDEYERYSE